MVHILNKAQFMSKSVFKTLTKYTILTSGDFFSSWFALRVYNI